MSKYNSEMGKIDQALEPYLLTCAQHKFICFNMPFESKLMIKALISYNTVNTPYKSSRS